MPEVTMNRKLLLGFALLPMMVLANDEQITQPEPKTEFTFPYAQKVTQAYAAKERAVNEWEDEVAEIQKQWHQSLAALSLALKSLANFDCNVLVFEIENIERYIKRNKQSIKHHKKLYGCSDDNQQQCTQQPMEIAAAEIASLEQLITKQQRLIVELNKKVSVCKSEESSDE